MAVVQTIGLSKQYGPRRAVDHLDLQIEQGDIYGFIGQNGAGKSTTLKLLCGLARPTGGTALLFGKPLRDPVAHRRVGALIEQPGLYPDLSGRENLLLYATLLGLDAGEKKPVKQYSMGMKQRLGVGLALLGGPDLLLLCAPLFGIRLAASPVLAVLQYAFWLWLPSWAFGLMGLLLVALTRSAVLGIILAVVAGSGLISALLGALCQRFGRPDLSRFLLSMVVSAQCVPLPNMDQINMIVACSIDWAVFYAIGSLIAMENRDI